MKKYCVIIGENNEEVSRQVQEALFAVGYKWPGGNLSTKSLGKSLLCLNWHSDATFPHIVNPFPIGENDLDGYKFLPASYVIAHAAELDGARKPWEIAPEGYRLVTEEERVANECPSIALGCAEWQGKWRNDHKHCWKLVECFADGGDPVNFSVPVDFTFAPPEKEIEVGGKMYSESTLKNALREYVA